jgi:hypothetical protein
MLELDHLAGTHIAVACTRAVALADLKKESVRFVFNEIEMIVHPGDSADQLQKKWHADFEAAAKAYRESPEYIAAEAQRAEELRNKMAASMTESATTEDELRQAKDPWPYTREQLIEYIDSLTERPHDYGTCVYALSLSALAAFNYVAHKLGVTGFQSSCADLDFLRRNRSIKGPFILLKAEDAMYPQSDVHEKLEEALTEWKSWLSEEAKKRLAETEHAHSAVIGHWKKLAGIGAKR